MSDIIKPSQDTSPVQQGAPLSPIQAAMVGGITPDDVKKLWDIQKDFEANEARKAYHQALAKFKLNEVVIEKDGHVKHKTKSGQWKEYRHPTLGGAMRIINPILGECGLSLNWKTSQDMENGGMLTVTAILTHAMGHSEQTSLSASPEDSGGKNNLQAIGSAETYLQRYTGLPLIGVIAMDADDDGGDFVDLITPEQVSDLADLANHHGVLPGLMKWLKASLKVDALGDIRADAFDIVEKRLESAIRANTPKGEK